MYRQLWHNNPLGIPNMGGYQAPQMGNSGQTLELGGMIYQYFVVGLHRPHSAPPMMTPFGPTTPATEERLPTRFLGGGAE